VPEFPQLRIIPDESYPFPRLIHSVILSLSHSVFDRTDAAHPSSIKMSEVDMLADRNDLAIM
jgi:hypothetical protein